MTKDWQDRTGQVIVFVAATILIMCLVTSGVILIEAIR